MIKHTLVVFTTTLAAALALLATPTLARAEWPDKPVRIIVPWPAGGGSDLVARMVAEPLGEALKQPIVIENRAGANGAIGSETVARARPDGYTFVWVTADTHAMNPHVYPKLSYDPRNDFSGVGIVGYFPYALVVNPAFAASTVAEFVAQARQRPGRVTFASWGVGGSAHVAMEMFRAQGQFDVLHVPYQGAAPAVAAVIGGQVDSMILPMSVAKAQAAGGKLKLLGLASPRRFAGAPDLKTFAEQGVAIDAGTWVGLMAPAKTPADVVARMNKALNDVVANPALREKLLQINVEPAAAQTPLQFQAFVDSEYERWGKIIRGANIRAE